MPDATRSPNAPAQPRRKPGAVPHTRKPAGMTLEEWQIALRRQFGHEQRFRMVNSGDSPVFSEFAVTNPQTRRTYRVSIRGGAPGDNHCTCPDFAVNTLGTCKHVEFVLARLQRRSAARVALRAGYQPPYSEVYLRYGAQRQVGFRPGADCPRRLVELAGGYFDNGILRREAFASFDQFLHEAHGVGHPVRCYEDAIGFIAQVRDQEALAKRIDEAFADGEGSRALEKLLKVPLYPYQRRGALFAARAGRALIADDMGLGKTIQAMAAAEILARCAGVERVLVVCPTSLKHQWRSEIEKFVGRSALVIEGQLPARQRAYASDGSFYKITNYDVVHRDMDLIRQWEPDLILLDEAQRIKNWRTRAAKSVKQLPSQYAIVLTGTPLENRLEELHSIVEFVDRFRLGPSFRFLAEHQMLDESGRVVGYRNLDNIAKTLSPILIRRTKGEVLKELPQRMERLVILPMTPPQMAIHAENQETVARIVAKWRRYGFLSEADQRRLTIALQYMRMSCDSTYLVDRETDHGLKADECASLLDEMLDDRDTKVVVFSQWVRMHELLASRLDKRGWPFVLFHGGVPGPQRKDLIARFKDDADCRLFLSTDSGGVGLNLQHASAVFNMDLPWNPAVLEQRIGRVHRLGQQRPVQVVNFVAENTIEHGMLGVLKFKKSLFAGVLEGGESEVFLGGTRLKKFMDSVEQVTGSVPPPQTVTPLPQIDQRQLPPEPARPKQPTHKAEPPSSPAVPAAPALELEARVWADLLSAGKSLLDNLSRAILPPQPGSAPSPQEPAATVQRDVATGQSYLRLPMPSPDTLQKVLGALASLIGPRG
jgi:superfamily II DNA or RNA helicase